MSACAELRSEGVNRTSHSEVLSVCTNYARDRGGAKSKKYTSMERSVGTAMGLPWIVSDVRLNRNGRIKKKEAVRTTCMWKEGRDVVGGT